MSLIGIAFAFAWHHRVATACTLVAVALATALLLLVLHVRRDVEADLYRHGVRADLVVGEPGSEATLVLAGVLYAGVPRGTVPYRAFLEVLRAPGVTSAHPLCLGDYYRGFPVVGTTAGFFDRLRAGEPAATPLREGRLFERDFEIVAGATAAERLKLKLGDALITTHGAAGGRRHAEHPYRVVGILENTGAAHDRALFTPTGSYWTAHASPAELEGGSPTSGDVSAVLVDAVRPQLFTVQRELTDGLGLMAVRPAEVMRQLSEQILAPVEQVLLAYGVAISLTAGGSILATLYLTTMVRRRDHAILRSLGALPREIFFIVLAEAAVQLTLGCGVGVLLSRAALGFLRARMRRDYGIDTDLFAFHPVEALAIAAVFAVGLLAALYPAVRAYRSDVAKSLRRT